MAAGTSRRAFAALDVLARRRAPGLGPVSLDPAAWTDALTGEQLRLGPAGRSQR